jgi:hypothetical protein
MQKSLFVISLDFELLWGVRDKRTIESYGKNILGVRKVIPALVDLFENYSINATFATVGFLFARNKNELQSHLPNEKPKYRLPKYSPYENNYLFNIGNSEQEDPYHYAESLIRMIQQSPNQEIASHTFSHYYCLENASLISFEEDMKAAKGLAATYSLDMKSIVFPRNQYSDAHVEVCRKLGFNAYRGNEASKIYDPRKNEDQNKMIRGTRLADSYFNITGHHTFKVSVENGMVNIPASRFLRPYSGKLKFADGLRLQRIKNSMSYAAKNNEGYHLWWHPHNFGSNLEENLSFLKSILQHYRSLHNEYGMQSKTMKTISEEILEPHAV